ncbi:hypothetical protein HDU89_006101 [Geranomyces variabilis]|nr:hypothetical protein HDU89_006101 [Geranomyces variabilis]
MAPSQRFAELKRQLAAEGFTTSSYLKEMELQEALGTIEQLMNGDKPIPTQLPAYQERGKTTKCLKILVYRR